MCDYDPEEQRAGHLAVAGRGPVRVERPQDQPDRHARLRRLHGRRGRGAARRRPRRLRGQRGRRRRGADRGGVADGRRASASPGMVFVNKLDRERASFDAHARPAPRPPRARASPRSSCRSARRPSSAASPTCSPTPPTSTSGGVPHTEEIPDDMEELEHQVHDNLVEGIVVADDDLLERFLDGDVPVVDELEHTLHDGIAARHRVPGASSARPPARSASTGWPTSWSRSARRRSTGRPITVAAGDSRACEVAADPGRRPAGLRVQDDRRPLRRARSACSGCCRARVRPDDHLVNSRTGSDERLHGLFTLRGKEQEPASELVAGDIGAVAKLADTVTGDTLAPQGQAGHGRRRSSSPSRRLAVAIVPRTQADEDKLATALHRLHRGGPGAARSSATTRPTRPCCGAPARPTCRSRSRSSTRKFGVNVDTEPVRVPYRETITGAAQRASRAGTRSRPAATASSACASSTSSRCPGARASSSSTRSSAAPSAAATSPPCRRASRRPWRRAACFGYPVVDVQVDADRRQGALGRLLGDGVQGGRPAGVPGGAWPRPGPVRARAGLPAARSPCRSTLQGDVMGDLNARRGRVQGTEPAERRRADGRSALVPDVGDPALRHRAALAHRRPGPVQRRSTTTTTSCPPTSSTRCRREVADEA